MFDSISPSIAEVIEYYISSESPLKNIPKMTQMLKYDNKQTIFSMKLNVR
jgi:hypothetical protein